MDPRVLSLPGVKHIRKMSTDALEDLRGMECLAQQHQQQLQQPGDTGGGGADIVVCDANQYPSVLAGAIKEVLPFLRPGGWIVLTLKYRGSGRKADDQMSISGVSGHARPGVEAVHDVLGDDIDREQTRCAWLLANTVHERCLVLRKAVR
jgi:hypothetical protein